MEKMVTSLSLFRKHGYGSSSVPVVITVRSLTLFPKNILKSESDVDLYLNVLLMFRYLCILSHCREKDSEEKGDKGGDMAVSPGSSSPWRPPHPSGGSPFRMGQAVVQVAAQCCGTPAPVGELGKLWGERG